jgi:hypothetical protein
MTTHFVTQGIRLPSGDYAATPRSLDAACCQGLDLFAPHVQVVWQADRFETAGDDEIEHRASVNRGRGAASGQRISVVVAATYRTYSTASRVGQTGCWQ